MGTNLRCAGLVVIACVSFTASATSMRWLSRAEHVSAAERIVRGVVVSVAARRLDEHRGIVTDVTVQVRRHYKGGALSRLELTLPGGRVGDEALVVAGTPSFTVGDDVVLFTRSQGKRTYLTALSASVFWITASNGRAFARQDLADLSFVGAPAAPRTLEPLEHLEQTIADRLEEDR